MGLSCIAKMKIGACALLMIAAQGAQAQFIAEHIEKETPSGALAIEENSDGFTRALVVGDARFFAEDGYQYLNVVDQRGSLYLIELGSGGNGCPAVYVWLHSDPAPRITEVFGNCAYMNAVTSDGETVTVAVPSRVAAEGDIGFVYDGRSLREVVLGQKSAGIGLDPADWIGRTPFEMFADADWRARLVELLGEENYRTVGDMMEMSSGVETVDGWIVADGFKRLDGVRAVVALHPRNGQIVVAVQSGANGHEVWGNDQGALPEAVYAMIEFR